MFIMAADNPLPDVIPMVTMPEDLIHLLTELHTVPVATTGPEGKPNIAAKSVMVLDPETIVWGELYFMQTYENLLQNPRASICVWKRSPPFTAYKVNGRVTIHENDEIAAQLDERVRTSHKMEFKARREKLAAVYFTVEEVYDQTPSLESAGKRVA
jgi:predicted pyridoxine 5'-phosphate oxidase superfamily flavin-nucleotide-binding protein